MYGALDHASSVPGPSGFSMTSPLSRQKRNIIRCIRGVRRTKKQPPFQRERMYSFWGRRRKKALQCGADGPHHYRDSLCCCPPAFVIIVRFVLSRVAWAALTALPLLVVPRSPCLLHRCVPTGTTYTHRQSGSVYGAGLKRCPAKRNGVTWRWTSESVTVLGGLRTLGQTVDSIQE